MNQRHRLCRQTRRGHRQRRNGGHAGTRVGQTGRTRHRTPRNTDPSITPEPWIDFSSGYVRRSLHLFAKQGSRAPWKLYQNYPRDILLLRFGKLDDGVLEFAGQA